MPTVKPRTPSRGEIHELQRLQATYTERLRRRPSGSRRLPDFLRPKRLDGVT